MNDIKPRAYQGQMCLKIKRIGSIISIDCFLWVTPNLMRDYLRNTWTKLSMYARESFFCFLYKLKYMYPPEPWLYSLAWWDSNATHVILATPDKKLMKSSLHIQKGSEFDITLDRITTFRAMEDYISRDAFKFLPDCTGNKPYSDYSNCDRKYSKACDEIELNLF